MVLLAFINKSKFIEIWLRKHFILSFKSCEKRRQANRVIAVFRGFYKKLYILQIELTSVIRIKKLI